jgi:DNA-binding transcriptional ArsR family regulator
MVDEKESIGIADTFKYLIVYYIVMGKKTLEEVLEVLEKPTYTEILLCIISGKNYATAIAKFLNKKQPTVTEQLSLLEKLRIIKFKTRGKAKEYEVNWDVLLTIFYDIIKEVLDARSNFLSKKEINRIKKVGIKNIVPPELIKIFLKEYFLTFVELGGKRKGFDEIIFSFFSALNNLEKKYMKKLTRIFRIDENALYSLADLMEFEISGIEQTAIMTYLDMMGEKHAKKKEKK